MIKSQSNLAGEYTYISRLDDAVDRPTSDDPEEQARLDEAFERRWERYLEGAEDAPLKPGVQPTIFHLRHLKAGETNSLIRNGANGFDLARAALVGVNGAEIQGYKFKLVERDGIKVANIDDAPAHLWPVFVEVGGRVMKRMTPNPKS